MFLLCPEQFVLCKPLLGDFSKITQKFSFCYYQGSKEQLCIFPQQVLSRDLRGHCEGLEDFRSIPVIFIVHAKSYNLGRTILSCWSWYAVSVKLPVSETAPQKVGHTPQFCFSVPVSKRNQSWLRLETQGFYDWS